MSSSKTTGPHSMLIHLYTLSSVLRFSIFINLICNFCLFLIANVNYLINLNWIYLNVVSRLLHLSYAMHNLPIAKNSINIRWLNLAKCHIRSFLAINVMNIKHVTDGGRLFVGQMPFIGGNTSCFDFHSVKNSLRVVN